MELSQQLLGAKFSVGASLVAHMIKNLPAMQGFDSWVGKIS